MRYNVHCGRSRQKMKLKQVFFMIKTKFRAGIWCSKMIQDLQNVFIKSWMKTNFHFLKTFTDLLADGSKKYIFVLFWFLFFLLVNIVFNMNFFIWNRSDPWYAHNQRLKIPMFFRNFFLKVPSCKHQPHSFKKFG